MPLFKSINWFYRVGDISLVCDIRPVSEARTQLATTDSLPTPAKKVSFVRPENVWLAWWLLFIRQKQPGQIRNDLSFRACKSPLDAKLLSFRRGHMVFIEIR